jgi:translocation and assembly module TamA
MRLPFPRLRRPILAVAALAAACTPARMRVEAELLRDVRFDGNGFVLTAGWEGQSDYVLRQQIANKPSPFLTLVFPFTYFREPRAFHPEALEDDARRIETWYAHHGWFDANFQQWDVKPRRRARAGRAAVVDLVGRVTPGRRSWIRTIEIEGLSKELSGIGRAVKRTAELREGEAFDRDAVYALRDALRRALHDHSYAYADVSVSVDAYPEESMVDVRYRVDAGIRTHFGPVTLTGNRTVQTEVLRDEIPIVAGKPYKLEVLEDSRKRLNDLGIFSVVTVAPDLRDPKQAEIPVQVHVSESRSRNLRIGGGIDYDGYTLAPRAVTTFRHPNLFGTLTRFESRIEGGFSGRFGETGLRATPVFRVEAGLARPRLLGDRRWSVNAHASVEQDLLNAQLPFLHPEITASLAWTPHDHLAITFGPHWEQRWFPDLAGSRALQVRALFGENFENPYQLAALDLNANLDATDDPLSPRRGRHWAAGFRQVVPFGAQDFNYSEINVDLRGYASPTVASFRSPALRAVVPEVLAGRLHVQALKRWGDTSLPYPELARMGGSTDLRGFMTDRVGPYDCLCFYDAAGSGDGFSGRPGDGTEVRPVYLERGGAFAALFSSEARYELGVLPGTGVVFADGGVLTDDVRRLRPRDLRIGVGAGYRYPSPVGAIRIDLGVRPLYPEDRGPESYLDCNAGDRIPRSYDLFSIRSDQRDPSQRDVPFAVNVFIGIGEAI